MIWEQIQYKLTILNTHFIAIFGGVNAVGFFLADQKKRKKIC